MHWRKVIFCFYDLSYWEKIEIGKNQCQQVAEIGIDQNNYNLYSGGNQNQHPVQLIFKIINIKLKKTVSDSFVSVIISDTK